MKTRGYDPLSELSAVPRQIWLAVLVAALGYFVDIYDLLLFSIVRVSSLRSLGIAESQMLDRGVLLINSQMAGLLFGGFLWGILGDKRGRLSVLFGSIFLYSVANLANAFVQNIEQYAVLRFIAGIGLAGELGAGITLISEIMPTRLRGYGTTLVATIGIFGAVFAGLIADNFDWRTAYVLGAVLGLLILALRFGVKESKLFHETKAKAGISRGHFWSLLKNPGLLKKYLLIVFIGVPIWYVVGILMTFTPEIAREFGLLQLPTAGKAILFCYLGISFGDVFSGLFCQYLESRKRVLLIYLIWTACVAFLHLLVPRSSLVQYYAFCFFLGVGAGYWAIFVTVAAEQFGTNLRSTVTTSAPNLVRAAVIPLTLLFQGFTGYFSARFSAGILGFFVFAVALLAWWPLEETFARDLDYLEQ